MPFADRDAVTSGRNSRASDLSGPARSAPRKSGPPQNDMFSSGVMSMLRTGTDTGDIGSLSVNHSRLPTASRHTHHGRSNLSRLSDTSQTHYAPSHRSTRSGRHNAWETSSTGRRGSISSLQTTKTVPPYFLDASMIPPMPMPPRNMPYNPSPSPSSRDGRSFSLTRSQAPHNLSLQRSVSSLRSQSTAPGMGQKAPYIYPARLKRSGYRSVSPALSDFYGASSAAFPPHGRHIHRPPLTSYHSDYTSAGGLPQPPRHFPGPMPPLRRPATQMPPNQIPNHHMVSRQMPAHHIPSHQMPPHQIPIRQLSPQQMNQHQMPPTHMSGGSYMRDTRGYQMRPSRPGPVHPTIHHGAPPMPAMPPRAYTPNVESPPSSSGPSSSAAPSSNPPTPRDTHTSIVNGDQGFADPALTEIVDDLSEHMPYLHYLDSMGKINSAFELEAEVPVHVMESTIHPISSQKEGFVQRIKALLDERATVENVPKRSMSSTEKETTRSPDSEVANEHIVAELPAFPVKDEAFQASVPVKHPSIRITRDLVRKMTAPSVSEQATGSIDLQQDAEPDSSLKQADVSPVNIADAQASPDATFDASRVETFETQESVPPSESGAGTVTDTSAATETDDVVQLDIPQSGVAKLSHLLSEHNREESSQISMVTASESHVRDVEDTAFDSAVSPMGTQSLRNLVNLQDHSPQVPRKVVSNIGQENLPRSDRPDTFTGPTETALSSIRQQTETTLTSEIVTDIAVRFSLPRRSDIDLRPDPQSENQNRPNQVPETKLHKEIFELSSTISPRQSLYQATLVAPLQIKKSDEALIKPAPVEAADLSSFIRRTFPRRQSILPADANATKRNSFESANESRAAAGRNGPGHLPRLKEDSQEDIPSAALRSSDFVFPLPVANVKAPTQLPSMQIEAPQKIDGPASQHPGAPLSDSRGLPSLNFSQTDLIEQLNTALDGRSSRSLDLYYKKRQSAIIAPSPLRPSSTEALRERYTSFFYKPEEFHVPTPIDDSESFSIENLLIGGKTARKDFVNAHKLHARVASAASKATTTGARPLSPQELLSVASEANRLSIPSVAGLSERLSGILPSLKHLHLDSIIANDEQVKNTIEEIHHLGQRARSFSVRSSAGLRSLAAAADELASNEAIVPKDLKSSRRLSKDLPPLPLQDAQVLFNTLTESKVLSANDAAILLEGLEMPKPALLRTLSEGAGNANGQARSSDISVGSRAKRSLTTSAQTSRPWNLDENHPWSNDTVAVDLGLPRASLAHCRESITSDLLRHTAKGSQATISGLDNTLQSTSTTLSSVSEFEPTATVTGDTLTNQHNALRSKNKKSTSVLESLSRKATTLKGHPVCVSTDDTTHTHRDSRQTLSPTRHSPGDRYPSTALNTLHSSYNLDEVRSFFSDDSDATSSQTKPGPASRRGSQFKTRLGSLKMPAIMISRPLSDIDGERDMMTSAVSRSRSLDHHSGNATPGVNSGNWLGLRVPGSGATSPNLLGLRHTSSSSAAHGYGSGLRKTSDVHDDGTESLHTPLSAGSDAFAHEFGAGHPAGMGKVEVKVKRVMERMRGWWVRGGDLVRCFSGRGRRERDAREREEWLDDSVYSGT